MEISRFFVYCEILLYFLIFNKNRQNCIKQDDDQQHEEDQFRSGDPIGQILDTVVKKRLLLDFSLH